MINAKLNRKAWKIRRKAAKKFHCKITDVIWKLCLVKAVKRMKKLVNKFIRKQSAFMDLKDLMQSAIKHNYRPSLNVEKSFQCLVIAEVYDNECSRMGLKQKAFRW